MRRASGTTRSPTGTSSSASSPATARGPPSDSSSGACRARRRPGCATSSLRRPRRPVPVWEVFRQEREGQPLQHGGSLEAPNAEFADAYAREFYGRRNESTALWVVPRDAIAEVRDPYVAEVFDRDYRRVDGYSIKVKLREARERAGHGPPLHS